MNSLSNSASNNITVLGFLKELNGTVGQGAKTQAPVDVFNRLGRASLAMPPPAYKHIKNIELLSVKDKSDSVVISARPTQLTATKTGQERYNLSMSLKIYARLCRNIFDNYEECESKPKRKALKNILTQFETRLVPIEDPQTKTLMSVRELLDNPSLPITVSLEGIIITEQFVNYKAFTDGKPIKNFQKAIRDASEQYEQASSLVPTAISQISSVTQSKSLKRKLESDESVILDGLTCPCDFDSLRIEIKNKVLGYIFFDISISVGEYLTFTAYLEKPENLARAKDKVIIDMVRSLKDQLHNNFALFNSTTQKSYTIEELSLLPPEMKLNFYGMDLSIDFLSYVDFKYPLPTFQGFLDKANNSSKASETTASLSSSSSLSSIPPSQPAQLAQQSLPYSTSYMPNYPSSSHVSTFNPMYMPQYPNYPSLYGTTQYQTASYSYSSLNPKSLADSQTLTSTSSVSNDPFAIYDKAIAQVQTNPLGTLESIDRLLVLNQQQQEQSTSNVKSLDVVGSWVRTDPIPNDKR